MRESRREELASHAARWVELSKKAESEPLTPAESLELATAVQAIRATRKLGRIR